MQCTRKNLDSSIVAAVGLFEGSFCKHDATNSRMCYKVKLKLKSVSSSLLKIACVQKYPQVEAEDCAVLAKVLSSVDTWKMAHVHVPTPTM